jgi:type I restriction enzyme, S subunit
LKSKQIQEFKETEIGKISSDWNIQKLGDIFELSQGLQISSKKRISEKKDGYIPLLKIRDLPTNKFSEFVSLNDVPQVYVASKDDIIYTRTGQVGLVYTNVEGCVHNNCFKVHYGNFDKLFVYYMLKQNRIFHYANSVAGGSVQKDLTHPAFKSCTIPFPKDEREQNRIGVFLHHLDLKIGNLQNQNKNLEQTIQTIFKSWFIDFDGVKEFDDSELGKIPKEWSIKKLPEVTKIVDCLHITKSPTVDNNAYLLQVFNIVKQGLIDLSKKYTVSNKDYEYWTKNIEVREGDCIISNAGRVGAIAQIPYDLIGGIGRNITAIRPENVSPTYLLEYLFSKLGQQEIYLQTDSATIFNTLNVRGIKKIRILIPDNNLMKKFEFIARPYRKLMEINYIKIKELIKIRDILLPKLMSGEIRV